MTEESPEETANLLRLAMSIPAPGQYTPMDRYRDFRKVFMGSEDGQRVFREILSWGHMFKISFDKDPGLLAFKEGERNMALRLIMTVSAEPKSRPTKAKSKPDEGNT